MAHLLMGAPFVAPSFDVTPKIVGGDPVTPFDHNWLVSIDQRTGGWYGCGGSLISESWVVTAAHCYDDPGSLSIGVHRHEIDDDNAHGCTEVIEVEDMINHPGYDPSTFDNDIALIKLKQPVTCVNEIDFPSFDDGSYSSPDTTVKVAGWGTTSSGGSVSDVLLSVEVEIVDHDVCNLAYSGEIVEDSMICAGNDGGGEDACQGDSGGPLFYELEDGRDVLVGVVSWGYGCAHPDYPGVYARFSSYLDWIKGETGIVGPPEPPEPPEPPSGCAPWCNGEKQCGFKKCKKCPFCKEVCPNWCKKNTNPEKCEWMSCKSCDFCSDKCPSGSTFCGDGTEWDLKEMMCVAK